MMDALQQTRHPPLSNAERQRALKERRRRGERILRVAANFGELCEALVECGYLPADQAEDVAAAEEALARWVRDWVDS